MLVGVVVLGMGRSGTSAVARMFARAGCFAGREDELLPATEANPAGHFEHSRIVMANEWVLAGLGGSWFDPPSPESSTRPGPTSCPLCARRSAP
jgi:hypothetical protein